MKSALPARCEEVEATPPAASRSSQLESPRLASAISLGSVDIEGLLHDPDSPLPDAAVGSRSPLPGAARWWSAQLAATPASCLSSRSDWSTSKGSVVSSASSPGFSSGAESEYVERLSAYFRGTPAPTPAQTQSPCMQDTPALSPASALCLTSSRVPMSQVPTLASSCLLCQLQCALLRTCASHFSLCVLVLAYVDIYGTLEPLCWRGVFP